MTSSATRRQYHHYLAIYCDLTKSDYYALYRNILRYKEVLRLYSQYITTMKITGLLNDDAVLAELGARITSRRLEMQLTQAAVAEQAGIAKRTLERMEAGQASQLATLVRVLRVLDAASGLDNVIPESGPRPMDLLKQKGKVRKRASGQRAAQTTGKPWRWDETP